MYKLLLSWRYLRTRFIALASIISVTLGVATLIVVNSVMSGFVDQMKSRMHGILSDVEVSAPMLGEIRFPDLFVEEVKRVVGDDLQALTCVVRTPGMLTARFNDRPMTQQVILMGIDDETFGNVTDFRPYLMNETKRNSFSFQLETSGYPAPLDASGWDHRNRVFELEKFRQQLDADARYSSATAQFRDTAATELPPSAGSPMDGSSTPNEAPAQFPALPETPPDFEKIFSDQLAARANEEASDDPPSAESAESWESSDIISMSPFDPHSADRPQIKPEEMFDPAKSQYTGIILGVALSKRKYIDVDEKIKDVFMIRPGDDVQVMIPTVGSNASVVTDKCTIVDFYSSNMHEYDSMFAFMPISELQKLRGMVDPMTGVGSVSTIQIKLKPDVNLDEVRDRLLAAFPVELYNYDIHTWLDTQAPLLSAVQMELKVLNILLFLIIAVAGFGILATFYMIVVEKTKDIGILKALGAPSSGIMSIFLSYGLSLGMVGTGAGILLGLAFAANINQIADVVEWMTGREVFDPTIYYFSEIPTLISPLMVLWVALGAVAIAVLASVLPALRAARLHPVEALRYE